METERTIQRVLVACVGEAAALLLRSFRSAGVESVAIFLEESGDAPYVDDADYPVLLPSTPGVDPFSDDLRVVSCAMDAAADAFHAGTRAVKPEMVQLLTNLNLGWIGAKPEHLLLGTDPVAARRLARDSGIEVPPQTPEVSTPDDARAAVERLGPPLLELQGGQVRRLLTVEALRAAAAEVQGPTVYERDTQPGRMVVVAVVGDGQGGAVALPEIEESIAQDGTVWMRECPSPAVTPEVRARLQNLAGEMAHRLEFLGVMCVEFALRGNGIPWFHRVWSGLPESWWLVDAVGGVDLVGAQLVLARGDGLGWDQEEVQVQGHALHLRMLAMGEGVLGSLMLPEGADVLILRGEGAVLKAGEPIACFRVQASTRHAALVKAQVLLQHVEVEGIETNQEALLHQLSDRRVWEGLTA